MSSLGFETGQLSDLLKNKSLPKKGHFWNLWELYAIRCRSHNGSVYLIHPPGDVGGSPVIVKYRLEDYQRRIAKTFSRVVDEKEKLQFRYQITFYALLVIALAWFVF